MEQKVNVHPNPGMPDPEKARFKLVIYFKNGTRRTFYNFHTAYNAELKKVIECEKTGLNKLHRMIIHKFSGAYKTALIYYIDPSTTFVDQYGQERKVEYQLMKFVADKMIQCSEYVWEYRDGAVRMKFNQLRKVG